MVLAIEEAKKAAKRGDYAIGAVIERNGEILATGGNRVKTKIDSTRHAELSLIQYVVGNTDGYYINDCVLYTTHAPCLMCLNAAIWVKMKGLIYGASQQNITDYGKAHGNNKFKWRGLSIEPEEAYEKYLKQAHPNMFIKRDMIEECKQLFAYSGVAD